MGVVSCFLLVYIIHTANSVREVSTEGLCDLLSEDTKYCYVKEILAKIVHSPNQMAVDNLTNTLYFSFDSGLGEYFPAVLNIETKKLTVLKGIKDAFAIAHDSIEHEIYFGGSHGIYKYNSANKRLKRLTFPYLDVWWLVIKKDIYFVKFPTLKAYQYVNRTVKAVPELTNDVVNQFVFDIDNNIIFINGSGLFGVKAGGDNSILLKDYPRFLGIASNHVGHVYLCNENGIYVISKMKHKVKKVVNVQGVLGMAFDSENNIIYSDSHEIVRLKLVSNSNFKNNSKSNKT